MGAVDRAKAKPLRWGHLANFRGSKGPVGCSRGVGVGRGVGREERDRDREVEVMELSKAS